MFTLIVIGVVAVAAVGGLGYWAWASPPKALLAMTAAGAILVLPYTVASEDDGGVGMAINPATGSVTTTFNGVGVDPSSGSLVVGGLNAGSGQVVISMDLDPDEYLRPSKRGRVQEGLAADGISAREVELDAPAGFKQERVQALLVEPTQGESREETLRRVQRSLQRQDVDTTRREGMADRF